MSPGDAEALISQEACDRAALMVARDVFQRSGNPHRLILSEHELAAMFSEVVAMTGRAIRLAIEERVAGVAGSSGEGEGTSNG